MSDAITDDQVIDALLLPLDPSKAQESYVDRMLALAEAVMPESQEGDDDDADGEPDTPGHAAVRQTGDVELA